MDGHFVPNLSFGPGAVAALAPLIHDHGGMVECHLMIYEPEPYLGEFSRAGADLSTVPPGPVRFRSLWLSFPGDSLIAVYRRCRWAGGRRGMPPAPHPGFRNRRRGPWRR
jgi:hypothetical protein